MEDLTVEDAAGMAFSVVSWGDPCWKDIRRDHPRKQRKTISFPPVGRVAMGFVGSYFWYFNRSEEIAALLGEEDCLRTARKAAMLGALHPPQVPAYGSVWDNLDGATVQRHWEQALFAAETVASRIWENPRLMEQMDVKLALSFTSGGKPHSWASEVANIAAITTSEDRVLQTRLHISAASMIFGTLSIFWQKDPFAAWPLVGPTATAIERLEDLAPTLAA